MAWYWWRSFTQGPHWLEKVHAHMRDMSVVREGMIVGKLFNAMTEIFEELHPVATYGQQVSSPRGHVYWGFEYIGDLNIGLSRSKYLSF